MLKFIATSLTIVFLLIMSLLLGVYFLAVEDNADSIGLENVSSGQSVGTSALSRAREALVVLGNLAFSPLEQSVTKVVTPGPLNLLSSVGYVSYDSRLTPAGVIAFTNEERLRVNLPALTESAKLNEVARRRLEDMFLKQYFAHNSPAGNGVAEEAKVVGYAYIVVGENLALGSFSGDKAVVRAWMDSAGHKANMLAKRYSDIGVAVGEGMFKGRRAQLAVQIFGTPLALCPVPSESIKSTIYANKEKIDNLQKELAQLKTDIGDAGWMGGSTAKTSQYNKLANEFNKLIEETKVAIENYNSQVRIFNNCANNK